MESKLELKHLSPYLPHNLQIIYNSDNSQREMIFLDTTRDDYKHIFKPLLLPVSAYSIWLPEVLKKISLFDLSHYNFHCEAEEDEGIIHYWCNASIKGVVVDSVTYDLNLFEVISEGEFKLLNPQFLGIECLQENHVDYMGLIESGLALDKRDFI